MPPKNTESVEEAETAPLTACSGPVMEPSVRPLAPETVRAVVEAYGKVDASVVEVAVKVTALGEEVETIDVPLNERSVWLESAVLLVPPFAMGSVPVTCVARLMRPEREENERQVPPIAKHPFAMLSPPAP